MTILLSILAFLILLTGIILIHELGHFLAARSVGVVVEEFGFGLPPRVKTLFKQGTTIFTFNWIPFGGFVRLKGENAITERERRSKGSFSSVSIPKRIMILVAGVFMNVMLAVILLTIGFSVGRWIPTFFTIEEMQTAADRGVINLELGVLIQEVVSGESAAKVGVPSRSHLVAIDGVPVTMPEEVVELQKGKNRVNYTVRTGEGWVEEQNYSVSLVNGKAGVDIILFPVVLSAPERTVSVALLLSLRETWAVSKQTVIGIGHLFSSIIRQGTVPEGIAGIVGIAQLTHASVQEGLMTYLRLVALLSLSLAVLNILPFPALDGGRLLFVFAELIRRRPVNRRFEMLTNTIGFGFLIFLLAFIAFYDVIRLFR